MLVLIPDLEAVSMGRKDAEKNVWRLICGLVTAAESQSLGGLEAAVRAHRECSSQITECWSVSTGSPFGGSETKSSTIGYDEQKAHFLYQLGFWNGDKYQKEGEQNPQASSILKCGKLYSELFYTDSACLSVARAGLINQEREKEKEKGVGAGRGGD